MSEYRYDGETVWRNLEEEFQMATLPYVEWEGSIECSHPPKPPYVPKRKYTGSKGRHFLVWKGRTVGELQMLASSAALIAG